MIETIFNKLGFIPLSVAFLAVILGVSPLLWVPLFLIAVWFYEA